MNKRSLSCKLRSIAVFRNVVQDMAISELCRLMSDKDEDFISDYGRFISALYAENVDLSKYILKRVLEDENFYIRGKASGKEFDPLVEEAVENELKIFQELSQVTQQEMISDIGYNGSLPKWRISDVDIVKEYKERIENIGRYGFGKYAAYTMFRLEGKEIIPIEFPDKQRLDELYSYEKERAAVVENTVALIEGRPAQNALLYGDAGTGKSSTVKAVVNEFADRGLRLIEMTKEQLSDIPLILKEISEVPLKFLIFIDDLSFTSGEDRFGALKAVLEGSASAKAANTVIYATSNRRHLVRESFADREGDDVHRNDTMQELLSLSARFGLRVNFMRPDKKQYIEIAKRIVQSCGINIPDEQLALEAEAFAMQGNGRSPRTAKQFAYQLVNKYNM